MWRTFIIGVAVLLAGPPASAGPCNGSFVKELGNVLTVSPTGGDDTANLQCAIDQASALGPGSTVQLLAGTYRTEQLLLERMVGTVRGAGRLRTTLRNVDRPVPIDHPVPWEAGPPARDNRYPALVSVTGGDVTLADLTLRIVGYPATEDWYFFGTGPYNFFVPALLLYGSHATLRAQGIWIAGGSCFPAPNGNLLVDIEFWNYAVSPEPSTWPASSTLGVYDSVFETCGGLFAADLVDARIDVVRSTFAGAYGVAFSDLDGSHVTVDHNHFISPNASEGVYVSAGNFGYGIVDTSLLVRSNRFASTRGIVLDANWFDPAASYFIDVECAIVGNNVVAVPEAGYYLGPGTNDCTIVGQGKGTIVDESGGAHVIRGVTPHGGGVGHATGAPVGRGMPR